VLVVGLTSLVAVTTCSAAPQQAVGSPRIFTFHYQSAPCSVPTADAAAWGACGRCRNVQSAVACGLMVVRASALLACVASVCGIFLRGALTADACAPRVAACAGCRAVVSAALRRYVLWSSTRAARRCAQVGSSAGSVGHGGQRGRRGCLGADGVSRAHRSVSADDGRARGGALDGSDDDGWRGHSHIWIFTAPPLNITPPPQTRACAFLAAIAFTIHHSPACSACGTAAPTDQHRYPLNGHG